MTCPECESEPVAFAVPPELREFVPGEETALSLCPRCLTLEPAGDVPDESSFEALPAAFPTDPGVAIQLALLLGLLDSLALYRGEITALLERVERAGVDPLLVLGRLAGDPAVEPALDLEARRRQLEQLL